MPTQKHPVSPIDPVFRGTGGVTGANSRLPQNVESYVDTMVRYHGTTPRGQAVGKNPAYGSVGNDGHWPGTSR